MARYGKEHKEATRRRIVEAAGPRLKRDGIDGSGVSVLMADAGLTNGAFYAHFTSKEDLVATAVADQLRQQLERYRAAPSGREGVERLVREYLSIEHRDDSEHGCPSAALLDEIGRCSNATKHAYTAGVLRLVDEIASRLAPGDPQLGARTDAQPVRAADRHAAALPRPRRPTPRRRGTRAGHRQRADASPQRLAPRLHRTRRRSRLLGLRWHNVHLAAKRVSSRAGRVEGPDGPVSTATKTKRRHLVDLAAARGCDARAAAFVFSDDDATTAWKPNRVAKPSCGTAAPPGCDRSGCTIGAT